MAEISAGDKLDPSKWHGWVHPLPSGAKARCGGPGLCSQCAIEAAEAAVERARANRLIPVEKWADDLAKDLSQFTD